MQDNSTDLFGEQPSTPGKTCTKCRRFKPFDQFRIKEYKCRSRPNRPARRDSACKDCRKERCCHYNKSPRGRTASKKRRCKIYGITIAEHDTMFAAQGGACALCGDTELPIDPRTGKPYNLAIDHCHATGKARALLCHHCNVGLGGFKDRPDLLQAAISYLARHAASSA
jgi:hypothetical protein